jgi:uncharacterized membrane protein YccC
MGILDTINWMDLMLLTIVNVVIGVGLGVAFAAWSTRSSKRNNIRYNEDLDRFRSDYMMARVKVRKANDQLVNQRRNRK